MLNNKNKKQQAAVVLGAAIAAVAMSRVCQRLFLVGPSPTMTTAAPPAPRSNNTDVLDFSGIEFMPYDSEGSELGLLNIIGPSAIKAFFPTFITKWLMPRDERRGPNVSIDILDARKDDSLRFEDTGFTLIKMEELRGVKWNLKDTESIEKRFREVMIPRLQGMFPNATRFEHTRPSIRGGKGLGKNKVYGAHLDFYPNDEAVRGLHEAYPLVAEDDWRTRLPLYPKGGEFFRYILGQKNTDADEMKFVLGLWMPAGMTTPICDFPLAVMDARTMSAEDSKPVVSYMNWFGKEIRAMHGGIKHRPEQRWYYHSYQEPDEMLVFHHYAQNQYKPVNPHTSFHNPQCLDDYYETRMTIEFRVAVFFPKENASQTSES